MFFERVNFPNFKMILVIFILMMSALLSNII
jgi:hypothetical protein